MNGFWLPVLGLMTVTPGGGIAICVFVLAIALLSYQPPLVLFAGFVAYAASGYVLLAWNKLRRRPPAEPAS